MSVRREGAGRPDRPVQPARGGRRSPGEGGRRAGPAGWSGARWRQVISLVLLAILALTGLASVTMSSTGLVPAVIMGVLVLSIVVAVGIGRALR